ncbi:hypothetical protein CDAR_184681 [Caerostris darwini]|uniref:Uncharacterized protein n=1 Tax=Caerostris darwini TaxID=1538125 RepID=A0AAV4PLV1_9ARAC|nr:hypothetical protein CDAR_184681 [Caerostris darwini]
MDFIVGLATVIASIISGCIAIANAIATATLVTLSSAGGELGMVTGSAALDNVTGQLVSAASSLPDLSDLGSSIDLLGIIDGAFSDVFGISISDFIQSILGFFALLSGGLDIDLGDLGGGVL